MVCFVLQVRCVEGWLSGQVEAFLLYICNNPDHLSKARGACCVSACSDIVNPNLLADRILSGPVGFRQCFIDDHDGWGARIIAHRKEPAAHETSANRLEEICADPASLRSRNVQRVIRTVTKN